ncbi:hypothetical protein [Knoellia aerolata]|uniref:DUF4034 domain-containing protein n=1 Tax=Knoellia aerolata DSM 18566 TaxID=1385519 RepID=A0A0A0K080_9MICO|nr:hypothetical protein [Knoellia aerolata]KGN41742.1 hypothetical protein N801_06200 [Knoellia aerolata DSM 18566]
MPHNTRGGLGRRALAAPQWLDAWREAQPDDPDLAVVDARRLVEKAWEQRTHDDASQVSAEQLTAFHETLVQVTERIQQAVDASPGDPVPWALVLRHVRGTEGDRETFDRYLGALDATDPHHYGARYEAMQYLCAKWFGSHEEMFEFARASVENAPREARVQSLLLDAVLEHLASDPSALTADPDRVEDAIGRARGYLDANPDAGHHLTAQTRNVLARVLFHLERHREAYEQMQLIGPHATSYPWRYWGDARDEFLTHRSHIVALAAGAS